jgi:catechol 2,3-dioxygenase-like lactoylglutathione lyase family enzyme
MKRIALIAAAALGFVASPALAQQAAPKLTNGIAGVKFGVSDFDKAVAFYTALGLKQGPKHNAAEWELDSADPAQTVRVIIVHDVTGRIKLAPGGGFLMITVPDMAATIAKLKALGYAGSTEAHAIGAGRDPDAQGQRREPGRAARAAGHEVGFCFG